MTSPVVLPAATGPHHAWWVPAMTSRSERLHCSVSWNGRVVAASRGCGRADLWTSLGFRRWSWQRQCKRT